MMGQPRPAGQAARGAGGSMGSSGRPHVLISHQWRDKQLAERLARAVKDLADVWMDYRDLRPGDDIHATIDGVLEDIDVVLLVWTAHAQASANVAAEIDRASELGVRIVPCFFTYDDAGQPQPPLPESLRSRLGIDFHHFGSGVVELAKLFVEHTMRQLPEADRDDPKWRLLSSAQGLLQYLATYRQLAGVDDDRSEWVEHILDDIEHYHRTSGDRESVQLLLDVARRSTDDDPEGIGALIRRLEDLLDVQPGPGQPAGGGRAAPTSQLEATPSRSLPASLPPANDPSTVHAANPPTDPLAHLVTDLVGADATSAWLAELQLYIDTAPPLLERLHALAAADPTPAAVAVVGFLQHYLDTDDDLLPASLDRLGQLDDAWLIVNTAYRLVESGAVAAEALPVDWQRVSTVDQLVRAVLPDEVLATLTQSIFEILTLIADEIASYQPWFNPADGGYTATMDAAPRADAETWEDRINERLLGTGLSTP
jgi:hypothetical protein